MKFILDGKEKSHQIYTKIIRQTEARLQANNYKLSEETNILELFINERHEKDARTTSTTAENDPEFIESQFNHFVADLFGAGLDTTMATIRWTLLYVALDSKVQQKLKRVSAACTRALEIDLFMIFTWLSPGIRRGPSRRIQRHHGVL